VIEIIIDSEQKRREAIGGLVLLDLVNKWKLKITKINKKRTLTQNRALHLFFKHVSIELSRLGIQFNYTGLKGLELEIPYTGLLVKELIWKPIQKSLFDIDSTADLETGQINIILDVLVRFFADKGIQIRFPSQIDLMIKEFEKNGIY